MPFLSASFILLVLAAPTVTKDVPTSAISVKADSIDVDHVGRKATLTGHVKVGWAGLALTADRIDIVYTESGKPTRWKASGQVRVTWQAYTITSKNLDIKQQKDTLVFKGPLAFTQGTSTLNARLAILNMKTKALSIKEVHGKMNLEQLIKKP